MSEATDSLRGERHVSEVAGRSRISRRHGAILIGLSGVCVAAWFAFHGSQPSKSDGLHREPPKISQIAAFEPPKDAPAPPPLPPQAPPAQPQRTLLQQALGPIQQDPLTKARAASLLGSDAQQHTPAPDHVSALASPEKAATTPESELASRLHTTILEGTKATVLPHPEFTLTMGTLIPCVLQTAMDSSAPGLVTCVTQQDVLGSTGSVVLMEKGTRIVGEYASQMHQGQNRMFVLWNRAETPNHVVITLGSPAADALGRAGFDGQVDTHFWARFGGALMLTFVDGAFGTATSIASQHGGTFLNFGSGQGAATEALQNTINIPPTLRKNQGEVVAVMAARDLDFSDVYALRLAR
jgi:type IV secretion system protein VirB10